MTAKEGKVAQLADHRPKDREVWTLQQAAEWSHWSKGSLYNFAYQHPEIRLHGSRKWLVWKDDFMARMAGEKSA